MHVVIIAGGAGSRLWPVSREAHPKPFIRMEDGFSLLQKTYLRGQLAEPVESVTTVTNRELFFRTEDDYRDERQANRMLEEAHPQILGGVFPVRAFRTLWQFL